MNKYNSLFALSRMRILLFLREPEAIFWTFVFPLVLAGVLGVAFRSDETVKTPIGIVEGIASQTLNQRLGQIPNAELTVFKTEAEGERALFRSRIDALVIATEGTVVRFHPGRPEGEAARQRVLRALEKPAPSSEAEGATIGPKSDGSIQELPLDRRGTRYLDFLFPGLIGMNLMGTGIWGVGFGVADMRQKKLLRRFLVTPMKRSHLLASFLIARIGFLIMELGVLTLFGTLVLDVPFGGSPLAFFGVALVGGLSFSGLGLLIASRAQTLEGVSGIMNFVMMPMWLASGVFFSYERFPEIVHPVLSVLPLTALNDALRAIMLEGAGLASIGSTLLVTAAWGLASFLLALKIFRWD